MTEQISPEQFEASAGVEDWRIISDGACASFRTGSFAAGARLVQAIAGLPGLDRSHPDVDLRHDGVTVRIVTSTTAYLGMTQRDVELARAISGLAREQRLEADPASAQSLLIIPGAPNIREVMPFWRAVLGYVPRPDSPEEDLVDPHDRGPALWFETMDEPRPGPGGGAIHIAVWVAAEAAEARIAAALAAGGHIVRDDYAPAWVTLADAAGNEADVATIRGRG